MKFDAYIDTGRFWYITPILNNTGIISNWYGEKIRKTAAFYSDNLNVYIDSSDGRNEDMPHEEYCGRIKKIIEECSGKRFIMFKCLFSEKYSNKIATLAKENNGLVLPFAAWSMEPHNFFAYLLKNSKELKDINTKTKKIYDVGFCAGLNQYKAIMPDSTDSTVSWHDLQHFGYGSGNDTGYFILNTRKNLYDKFANSSLSFFHSDKLSYKEYIDKSFQWNLSFSPPGNSEYTYRMFDALALGQIPFMRKNTYDFYKSWKSYIPEVDFESENWQQDVLSIIENEKYWHQASQSYYNDVLMPDKMLSYMFENITKTLDNEIIPSI